MSKSASQGEIKSAYRKLAIKYHPDRNQGDKTAEQKFKKISEAYAVLSDPEKKKQYDSFGESGFHQRYSSDDIFRGANFNDIFSDLGFGSQGGAGGFDSILHQMFGGGASRGYAPEKGADVSYPMSISFLEAYEGCSKKVSYRLRSGLKREFNVFVPAGIQDGKKLRVAGKGESSPRGGASGDLFIQIRVLPDSRFKSLDDAGIEVSLSLKPSELLLGTVKDVETPAGIRSLKVPAGLSPGARIRMRGYGFPRVSNKSEKGDLFVLIKCPMPKSLTAEQKQVVERMQQVGL